MNEARDFWDDYLMVYDHLLEHDGYHRYLDGLVRQIGAAPQRMILDAGSGTGNLSTRLKAEGAEVVSLDFSSAAQKIHLRKDREARCVLASLEGNLAFPDASFDGIVCASVLFSLSKAGVDNAIREFFRLLLPGGKLIVTFIRRDLTRLEYASAFLKSRLGGLRLREALLNMVHLARPIAQMAHYSCRMTKLSGRGHYRRLGLGQVAATAQAAGFGISTARLGFCKMFHVLEMHRPSCTTPG